MTTSTPVESHIGYYERVLLESLDIIAEQRGVWMTEALVRQIMEVGSIASILTALKAIRDERALSPAASTEGGE